MGLFSKLFGEDVEKKVGSVLSSFSSENQNGAGEVSSGTMINGKPVDGSGNPYSGTVINGGQSRDSYGDEPSGRSWGPVMPAEENQFNFNGSHIEYFEGIFRSEFPQYSIEKVIEGRATVFTFMDGGSKALVVELLNSSSGRTKLRDECRRTRVPYLRYYYDHHGWWNTKSYVIDRTRKAILG